MATPSPWKIPPDPFANPLTTKAVALGPAARILVAGHLAAVNFYNLFDLFRHERKGTTSDEEQDLLRAMLVFASAALDNIMKRVITDALPLVVERNELAAKRLREYAEGKLARRDGDTVVAVDHKLLTRLLLSDSPRAGLVAELVRDLTANSLQSKDEVLKILTFFGIDRSKICPDLTRVDAAFKVRNQIVHEMDVDLTGKTRKRTSRRHDEMRDHTKLLLDLAVDFLRAVDSTLEKPGLPIRPGQ